MEAVEEEFAKLQQAEPGLAALIGQTLDEAAMKHWARWPHSMLRCTEAELKAAVALLAPEFARLAIERLQEAVFEPLRGLRPDEEDDEENSEEDEQEELRSLAIKEILEDRPQEADVHKTTCCGGFFAAVVSQASDEEPAEERALATKPSKPRDPEPPTDTLMDTIDALDARRTLQMHPTPSFMRLSHRISTSRPKHLKLSN